MGDNLEEDVLKKSLRDLVDRELKWTQPRALEREYELRDGDEIVVTLRFRSMLGSHATAQTADGEWTFKRVGFLRTWVSIRALGSDQDNAVFGNSTWSGGGTLELPDGRRLPRMRTSGVRLTSSRVRAVRLWCDITGFAGFG